MTADTLHDYLTYSPVDPAPVAATLRGVWTPVEGGLAYVCRTCVGRLMGRGISIPVESHVWRDTADPYGRCVGCELVESSHEHRAGAATPARSVICPIRAFDP